MRHDEVPDPDPALNDLVPSFLEFLAVCSYVVSCTRMSGKGIVKSAGGPYWLVDVLAVRSQSTDMVEVVVGYEYAAEAVEIQPVLCQFLL